MPWGLEPASQALIGYSCSHEAGGRIKGCLATEEGRLHLCHVPVRPPAPSSAEAAREGKSVFLPMGFSPGPAQYEFSETEK